MATNNAINASAQGTLYNNGTGTISGIDAGTAGKVLTSNGTGVAPSFQAAGGGSGSTVAQVRSTSSVALSTGSGIALTGTTPTTSNTSLLISITYTPTNSSNILIFNFSAPLSSANASSVTGLFLFAGSTLISSFPFNVGTATAEAVTGSFTYYKAAGTTSSTVYAVYFASTTGGAYVLLGPTAAALYNGTGNSNISFIITEVTP